MTCQALLLRGLQVQLLGGPLALSSRAIPTTLSKILAHNVWLCVVGVLCVDVNVQIIVKIVFPDTMSFDAIASYEHFSK